MTRSAHKRRAGVSALLAALLVSGVAVAAGAAAPKESTTFGADGVVRASLGPHYSETGVSKLTPTADGGFVAESGGKVEAFLADGTPDPATPPSPAPAGIAFPALGGKRLILRKNAASENKLTRLDPDGSPDPDFGEDGTVDVRPSVQAVVELGSGKIAAIDAVLVGPHLSSAVLDVALLDQNGKLERGAGFRKDLEDGYQLREVIPTPDGGALVVDDGALLELGADGAPKESFGTAGLAPTAGVFGAHLEPDGSIATVGALSGSDADGDLAFSRFTSTGSPEAGFGEGGVRRIDLGAGELRSLQARAWAPDGSLLVAGAEQVGPSCTDESCVTEPIVAAIDAEGNLEAGFSEGGVSKLAAATELLGDAGASTLARLADGSVVIGGQGGPKGTVGFIAGLTADGRLDPSFGEGGFIQRRQAAPAGQALAGIAALPDGGLLAAATTDLDVATYAPVLIRYLKDGRPDPRFGGGDGYVALGPSGSPPTGFAVGGGRALTSLADDSGVHLLMYGTKRGGRVSSFGADGSATLPKGVAVRALAFAKDGDALVLATRPRGDEVLRYRRDGSLDTSFGRGGKARLRLPGGGEVHASSLALGAGGTLLVAGRTENRFALGALRPDGRPERGFGSSGWTLVGAGERAASQLATTSDGGSRIYLAGTFEEGDGNRIALMRFDRRGHLDPRFGHGGRRTAFYPRRRQPVSIIPRRHRVLVVLDEGRLPVLTFSSRGKVRREPAGHQAEFASQLRAVAAGNRLIVAWRHSAYKFSPTATSYLSERPLAP